MNTCAGVGEGERVVVVTDDERLSIARAVADAVAKAGGEAILVTAPARSVDNEEPAGPVAAAMRQADVIFLVVTLAMAHTRATREAVGEGARVVSMSAFTERMMREGGLFTDFHARKPLCDMLAERLTAARRIRVTNAAGTDLVLGIEGRSGNSHACLVRGPGFTAVPNIEANIAPVEGTAEGTLVVTCWPDKTIRRCTTWPSSPSA